MECSPGVRVPLSPRVDGWEFDDAVFSKKACRNLGLDTMVSFTGAFSWPFLYPFPQRPPGLIETSFDELAKR